MILLDTHAFVWLASEPERLSGAARAAIRSHPASLHLSVVSAWEVSLLVKRGRLKLPLSADEYLARAVDHLGIIELPLTRHIVQAAVSLPDVHNDPFDRILVAQCRASGLSLISCDAILPRYDSLQVIW
jgi:PIN domain nuclease of toxin-antitoxin system